MNRFHSLGAAGALVAVSTAFAGTVTVGPDTLAGSGHAVAPGYNFQGGLFNLTVNSLSGVSGGDLVIGNTFKSFCIEIGETVAFNGSYNYAVNTASISGGSSPNNPQPLVVQTAWLYSQYRAGALTAGGDAFVENNSDTNALQDAIWFFQNQLGSTASTDLSARAQQFVAAANASGWTTIGNVRVLNMGSGTVNPPYPNQDMLVLIPLPQGAGLASVGLLLVGARRRRSL